MATAEERRHPTIEQRLLTWLMGLVSVLVCATTWQVFMNLPSQIAALSERFALRTELESMRAEVISVRTELVRVATEQARRTHLFPHTPGPARRSD